MTPLANSALERARARFKSDPASQLNPIKPNKIAGMTLVEAAGIPANTVLLIAGSKPPQIVKAQVTQVKQNTRHITTGPVDNYMFQQGRKYALELATSLHAMDQSTICDNLRKSAAGKPEGYAMGIQSVVELIEGNL